MDTPERTPLASVVCLALVVGGFVLLIANFEWPTARLGRLPSEREILVYDVLPEIAAGYLIGLVAIAITRFMFPKSSIKVVLYVVGACAGLAALFVLALAAAIGAGNIRDPGGAVSFIAAPLAIATWGVISWCRPKRDAR